MFALLLDPNSHFQPKLLLTDTGARNSTAKALATVSCYLPRLTRVPAALLLPSLQLRGRSLLSKLHSMIARFSLLIGLVVFGSLLALGAKGDLTAKQARELLRRLGGAAMAPEQVRIKTISSGLGGNAVVEATIETAVRFKQEKGEWQVADIRLGDQHWESVELITEAVRREKTCRTETLLQKVAEALEAYKKDRGSYVVATDFTQLLDQLAPRYLPVTIRFDLWEQPLAYRSTGNEYRLSSAGPDLKPDTSDDLILEKR